jgi:hypothetical protein
MKKWLYVIAPGAMLAVFLFFYMSSRAETKAREQAHNEEVAKQKADADEKKRIAEQTAKEDAERRNAEREAEEVKAAKAKQDKYDADMAAIQADTDKSNALADTYAKQVSDLTIELDTLNKQKDALSREGFELSKKIELAEVARHNAEMEVQRLVEMIADRADQTLMAKMPPPPPPPKES